MKRFTPTSEVKYFCFLYGNRKISKSIINNVLCNMRLCIYCTKFNKLFLRFRPNFRRLNTKREFRI